LRGGRSEARLGRDCAAFDLRDNTRDMTDGDRRIDKLAAQGGAHFCRHVPEPSRFEVASAHPVFQRAEDVLYRSSSDAHGLGPAVEPGLHGVDGAPALTKLSFMLGFDDPSIDNDDALLRPDPCSVHGQTVATRGLNVNVCFGS
jgi:hypothetical protein